MEFPDIDKVTAIMEQVATEEMLPRFRRLGPDDISQKTGPTDLVTVVDHACERRLTAALIDLLPGSAVVGEEAASADSGVMNNLSGDSPVWIVDPLDGTRNYARGIDRFACIVALVRNGETVAGWIHDPIRGVTGVAEKGEGAFIGGRRLRVAESAPLEEMTAIATVWQFAKSLRGSVDRLRARLSGIYNEGCAGVEYLQLADGKAHISIATKLKPWDHVAGVLLHREAGGFSSMIDGGDYGARVREGVLVTAPDADSWEKIRFLWTGKEAA